MSRRVARRLADRGRVELAERFERQADVTAGRAAELKAVLDEFHAVPDEPAAQATG